MQIRYETGRKITADEFVDLLRRSTLAARRPVEDRERVEEMLAKATLLCTAWNGTGNLLIGVARSLTDFSYCCYLSDLAVDVAYQKQGIGRELVRLTCGALHPNCKVILLAAPAAQNYYSTLGFTQHPSAWTIDAGSGAS